MNNFLDGLDAKTMILIEILFEQNQEQLIVEWINHLIFIGEFNQQCIEMQVCAEDILQNLRSQLL